MNTISMIPGGDYDPSTNFLITWTESNIDFWQPTQKTLREFDLEEIIQELCRCKKEAKLLDQVVIPDEISQSKGE